MNIVSSSKSKLDYIWDTYHIPRKYIDANFSNYYPTCPEQEKAKNICISFAKDRRKVLVDGKGLFLQGPVGTGKTHLAVSTLRAIVENNLDNFGCRKSDVPLYGEHEYYGYSCAVISVAEFLETYRQSSSAKTLKKAAQDLYQQAKSCEVLVLDDVGIENPSDWGQTLLYSIIDLRYRMQRSTIVTTNCSLQQLGKRLGAPILSRVLEMCTGVKVEGEDYRKGGENKLF